MSAAVPGATVTILNGATVSNGIDLGTMRLVGFLLPVMTGVAITFQASLDNVTYTIVKKLDGSSYSITTASSTYVVIPPDDLAGVRWIKFVSGAAEGADRIITPIVRAIP
jgi:hypothetical protein